MSLADLYHAEILCLAKDDTGHGRLENAPDHLEHNPLCGDECHLWARIEAGVLQELAHETRGCVLCRAAAARLTELAQSQPSVETLLQYGEALTAMLKHGTPPPDELALFSPVTPRRARHACVLLPFRALAALVRSV